MNKLQRGLTFIFLGAIFLTIDSTASDYLLINHYQITLLPGYAVKDVTPPMADFELIEIYDIKDRNKRLKVYFGNAPSFPAYDWGNLSPLRENGNPSKTWFNYTARNPAAEGLLVFTELSYRGSQSPYTQVHYFADGLDSTSVKFLVKIVSSIKVARRMFE